MSELAITHEVGQQQYQDPGNSKVDRMQGHVGNLRKAFDEHSGDARDTEAESELSPTISQSGI